MRTIKPDVETITVWEELLIELETQLAIEKRKYPLTEREQLFANVIIRILESLNYNTKYSH